MVIRKYRPSDRVCTAKLFYDTVHSVNAADYSAEQLDAWADGNVDLTQWNNSFMTGCGVVAVENGIIVGFGDIDGTGYLNRLFVYKDFQNRGVGSRICGELEKNCRVAEITAHVSITTKSFFLKRGYREIKRQRVKRKGVFLDNYVMKKPLDGNL